MKNITDSLARIENKMCKHIEEGERPVTGTRDRVYKLEIEMGEMKRRFWAASIIGGLIGALIGSGSADLLSIFIRWIMHLN